MNNQDRTRSVDPVWEQIHKAREWGKYPPEELIRFVARHYYNTKRNETKLLDVGCGLGSAVWYFCLEGFSAYGIDSSPSAIDRLDKRLKTEGMSAHLFVGDISTCLPTFFQPESIDAITDITCLYALPMEAARRAVSHAGSILKKGGRLFSMTFGVETWGYGLGRQTEKNGFTDITEGPLKDRGFARFYSREDLEELYSGIPIVSVESTTRTMDGGRYVVKHWVVECRKD